MKKLILLFLLLSVSTYGQTANGTETKQNAFRSLNPQTVTSPTFLGTMGTDGTMGKTDATLWAKKTDLPAEYAVVVYVNATSPTTATIFDDVNPPTTNDPLLDNDTSNLYIGTDGSTWVYKTSPAGYVTKVVPNTSNFDLQGTSTDSGNDKTSNIQRYGGATFGGFLYANAEVVSKKGASDTVLSGSNFRLFNSGLNSGNIFQLNASNGVDLWNFASGTWNKRFTFSNTGNFIADTYNGYVPENTSNKSDSYTVSSSITYASTKALVDGLASAGVGSGTVTGVSVVTANGISGSVATSTTTPAITLSMQDATTSQSGRLTSTDWNNFNGKQASLGFTAENVANKDNGTLTTSTTTYPTSGAVKMVTDGKQATLVSGTNIKTINSTSLLGSGDIVITGGAGDMILASAQTNSGVKTFLNGTLGLRNVANTFTSFFSNSNIASRTYTLPDVSGTVAMTSDYPSHLEFNNTNKTVWNNGKGDLADNTSFGSNTLNSNTTGNYNAVIGSNTLNSNTTGNYNMAIGYASLQNNVSGSYNVAIGANSLKNNTSDSNTGIGTSALLNLSSGGSNIAIGNSAGNVYFGGSPLTTVNNSVLLGVSAIPLANSGTNEIVIGYSAVGKGSNTATLGNDSITETYLKGKVIGQVPLQLKDFYADVNNVSTTETDLLTYTTVANRLNATGEKIIASYGGTMNDVTASSQLKAYFAGTNIADTGALTMSVTGAWVINVSIIRTGTTTARAMVNISTPGASTAAYTKYTALTGLNFTTTNIIKITGTAAGATGGNDDITGTYGNIIWQPAAL